VKVFVAGAAGVIGRALVPMLVDAGHQVSGTTRSRERARRLEAQGAAAAVLDVFERDAVLHAVADMSPEVVIHQLTDLAGGFEPEDLRRNERLRREGTRNLVDACLAAAVSRLVAQSGAWLYRDGALPHREDDPLPTPGDGPEDATLRGITVLENLVLGTSGLTGIALRYGFLYGAGTGVERDASPLPRVSVEGAARAALLAIERGTAGAYNIVDEDPAISTDRARRELGWQP
jgi:nucleoside-diphosphate-sugar epimerase